MIATDAPTFTWNKYGVCINPEAITVYKKGRFLLEIYVAQDPEGTWRRAEKGEYPLGGFGGLPGIGQYRKAYATREDAIHASVRRLYDVELKHGAFPADAWLAVTNLLPIEETLGGLFA